MSVYIERIDVREKRSAFRSLDVSQVFFLIWMKKQQNAVTFDVIYKQIRIKNTWIISQLKLVFYSWN